MKIKLRNPHFDAVTVEEVFAGDFVPSRDKSKIKLQLMEFEKPLLLRASSVHKTVGDSATADSALADFLKRFVKRKSPRLAIEGFLFQMFDN